MGKFSIFLKAVSIVAIMYPVISVSEPTVAQADPYEAYKIYVDGAWITNISWAEDSRSLVFQTERFDNAAGRPISGVDTDGVDTWHQYFIESESLVDSDYWPLQPNWTSQQYQDFEVYQSQDHISFVFLSPNGRYAVYGGQVPPNSPEYYPLPLGIADLETNEHRILGKSEPLDMRLLGNVDQYSVYWSSDNATFVFETLLTSAMVQLYRVTGLEDLNTAVLERLTPLGGLVVNEVQFFPNHIFDLSADGNDVLMYSSIMPDGHFVLWDMNTDSGSVLPTEGNVAGARFLDATSQQIWFVDEGGLKQYDIPSNKITGIDARMTSLWADGGVYFSPDGRFIAAIDKDIGAPNALYVIPMPAATDD